MTEALCFGDMHATERWRLRPSAYALLINPQGLLAIVEDPEGFFLPGGGIESGEDAENAVLREIDEETGQDAHLLWHLAEADQYCAPASPQTEGLLKRSQFYLAELNARPGKSGELILHWCTPDEAAQKLTYSSQQWVVKRFERYLRP